MEVSFSMAIMELLRAGNAVRIAWGSTTCQMIFPQLMPTQYPASSCPLLTPSSVPRMVSAMYAASFSPSTITAAGNALITMPTFGSP